MGRAAEDGGRTELARLRRHEEGGARHSRPAAGSSTLRIPRCNGGAAVPRRDVRPRRWPRRRGTGSRATRLRDPSPGPLAAAQSESRATGGCAIRVPSHLRDPSPGPLAAAPSRATCGCSSRPWGRTRNGRRLSGAAACAAERGFPRRCAGGAGGKEAGGLAGWGGPTWLRREPSCVVAAPCPAVPISCHGWLRRARRGFSTPAVGARPGWLRGRCRAARGTRGSFGCSGSPIF
jgi:hypothetical protein